MEIFFTHCQGTSQSNDFYKDIQSDCSLENKELLTLQSHAFWPMFVIVVYSGNQMAYRLVRCIDKNPPGFTLLMLYSSFYIQSIR